MNTSKNLTIASLVLGGVGALLFIIYKVRGGKKSSLMANGSKLLIAIGIILLAIAVLLLSEDREPYSTKDNSAKLTQPSDPKNQYFLTKISGLAKNTLYSITANDGVLLICESDEKGEINIQKLVRDPKIPGLPMPIYQDMRIYPTKDEITIGNPKGDYAPGNIRESFTLVGRKVSKDNKVIGCVLINYGVTFTVDGSRVRSIGVINDQSIPNCPEN
ncbi:MAG: hypothetical protein ACTSQ8_25080 [Candidatus Helarchaeota archaeon]